MRHALPVALVQLGDRGGGDLLGGLVLIGSPYGVEGHRLRHRLVRIVRIGGTCANAPVRHDATHKAPAITVSDASLPPWIWFGRFRPRGRRRHGLVDGTSLSDAARAAYGGAQALQAAVAGSQRSAHVLIGRCDARSAASDPAATLGSRPRAGFAGTCAVSARSRSAASSCGRAGSGWRRPPRSTSQAGASSTVIIDRIPQPGRHSARSPAAATAGWSGLHMRSRRR